MANLLFQKPTDNIAANATAITVESGTGDPDYPPAFLVDLNPAKPFKFTTTTGAVLFEFAAPVTIEMFALIHHNLMAGLTNVRIQANSSNSWGSPPLNVALTIPTRRSDGFSANPHANLTGMTNTYKWWRLSFADANNVPIQIGEVWMGATRRTLAVNIRWDYEENDDQPLIEHVTDFQIRTSYSYGVSIRRYVAQLTTTDAGAAELYDWWRSCRGRALIMLMALDADVNDCMMARFNMSYLKSNKQFTNYHPIDLDIIEVSRGLVL